MASSPDRLSARVRCAAVDAPPPWAEGRRGGRAVAARAAAGRARVCCAAATRRPRPRLAVALPSSPPFFYWGGRAVATAKPLASSHSSSEIFVVRACALARCPARSVSLARRDEAGPAHHSAGAPVPAHARGDWRRGPDSRHEVHNLLVTPTPLSSPWPSPSASVPASHHCTRCVCMAVSITRHCVLGRRGVGGRGVVAAVAVPRARVSVRPSTDGRAPPPRGRARAAADGATASATLVWWRPLVAAATTPRFGPPAVCGCFVFQPRRRHTARCPTRRLGRRFIVGGMPLRPAPPAAAVRPPLPHHLVGMAADRR